MMCVAIWRWPDVSNTQSLSTRVTGTASASINAHLMLCAETSKVPSYAHLLVHTFILGVSEIMFTRFTVQRGHYFFLILSIAAAPFFFFFFNPLSECTVLAPVSFRANWFASLPEKT